MDVRKVRRINRNTGTVSIHYLKVDRLDGKLVRRYIRKADLSRVYADARRSRIDRVLDLSNRKYCKEISVRDNQVRAAIESTGLTMRTRRRMCRSRKSFYTLSAARNRFLILDVDVRMALGNPENLLLVDRRADSIMHSLRARGKKDVTVQGCFQQALDEFLQKKQEKMYPRQRLPA